MRSEGSTRWVVRPLDDLCEIFDGPHATPRETQSGPIFLGISSLKNGRLDLTEARHLSEEDFIRWTRRVTPREGDLVFSYETRIGEAALIPNGLRCCLGRRMGLLRPDDRTDSRFFLYAYLGPPFQEVIRERTVHGSTVDRILLTEMAGFPMHVPPLDEQRRIAWVLSSLDDKIENNRRIAETLEEVAATLFKARFVDFAGHEDFGESELGPIPRGWSVVPVGDLAQYINGKAFTKFGNGTDRMVIRIAELKSGPGGATVYTDHEAEPEFMASPGDILFAWSGSLDVYRWYRDEALINQHIFKVIPSGYPAWFVFHGLKQVMPHFQAIAADKATTMGHIKRSHLAEFSVAVSPPEDLQKQDREIAPLFERALQARIEMETLAQIRDRLLPRLISGELRVPPSDSVLAEVG